MFRNPRENASRDPSSPLRPSVGRPPSPPRNATSTYASTAANGPAMSSTLPSTSPSTRLGNAVLKDKSPNLKNGKAKPKGNGSILSFFKKTESQDESDLFVHDNGRGRSNTASINHIGQLGNHTSELDGAEDLYNDEQRFNESGLAVKRRRTSRSPSESSKDAANPKGLDGKGCTPPPADFDDERNPATIPGQPLDDRKTATQKPREQTGPFLDESDSEDEQSESNPSKPSGRQALQATNGDPHAASAESEEVKGTLLFPKPAGDGENRDGAEHLSEVPDLKREATSVADEDGFADFEGMEDFEDEYEGGEEYLQRRYEEEQEQLESDGHFEDGIGDGEDNMPNQEAGSKTGEGMARDAPTDSHSGTAVSTCPICNASFEGVSDQDASVHVNHCLDGNPTPLPKPPDVAKQSLAPEGSTDTPSIKEEPSTLVKNPFANYRRPVRPAKPGQESPFTFGSSTGVSSAFSKMMSGHAEDEAWATAAAAENAARGKPAYQRTCPFYKILPGFFICVDAFRYGAVQGCKAYFLSHFHSDHYVGLTSSWCHGPIYCSHVTANLVRQQLRVDPKWVVDLEFEKKVEVPGTQGVHVTMIPANHCPGSSIYLFEKVLPPARNGVANKTPKTQRVLHCGDFRACPAHVEHPLLAPEVMDKVTGKTRQQHIDVCYLDTTYLNPKYAFPSQEDVIQACADMCVSLNKAKVDENDGWEAAKRERAGGTMTRFVRKDSKDDSVPDEAAPSADDHTKPPTSDKIRGQLLVVVGTYSIGKERICLGIARALDSKIYAPPGKQRIVAALEDPELNARMTTDPRAAQVHMTPLFEIRADTLADYLSEYGGAFSRAVGFRPSGWNYRPPGSRFTESPALQQVLYSGGWKSGYGMRELVPQRGSGARASCFGVPYSEHSSFRELSMFCCALRIDKIIPTVNVGSAKSRERMKVWCERWAQERRKNGLFKATRPDGSSEWYPAQGTWELRTTL